MSHLTMGLLQQHEKAFIELYYVSYINIHIYTYINISYINIHIIESHFNLEKSR